MSAKDMASRVNALLAKAAATEFEAEREALEARALEIVTKYNIDDAMLAAKAALHIVPVLEDYEILAPFTVPKRGLFYVIAKSFGCRTVTVESSAKNKNTEDEGKSKGKIGGFPSAIESTRLLYTSLHLQGTMESEVLRMLGNTTRGFHAAFWYGYSDKIDELLTKTTETVVNSTPGSSLVLSNRATEVDKMFRKAFPHIKHTTSYISSTKGFNAGKEAATRANLHRNKATTRGNTKAIG